MKQCVWLILLFLILLCGCLLQKDRNINNEENSGDCQKNRFTVYGQENIYSVNDMLYFFDGEQQALCEYNFFTESKRIITEKAGRIKQTETGLYYIVGTDIYEIEDASLKMVYNIPEDAEYIGILGENIYWAMREYVQSEAGDTENYILCKIYTQNWNKAGEKQELVYDTNHIAISGSAIINGVLCSAQSTGVYLMDIATGKIEQVFYQDTLGDIEIYEGYTFFCGDTENCYELYQLDIEKGTVRQMTEGGYYSMTVKMGVLYYCNSSGLYMQDLKDSNQKAKSIMKIPNCNFNSMAVCGNNIVLRDVATLNLYVYDIEKDSYQHFRMY